MEGRRDRDYDGVPDWQEEANYADEAPIRGNRARMRGGGCALPVALLLVAAGVVIRRSPARLTWARFWTLCP